MQHNRTGQQLHMSPPSPAGSAGGHRRGLSGASVDSLSLQAAGIPQHELSSPRGESAAGRTARRLQQLGAKLKLRKPRPKSATDATGHESDTLSATQPHPRSPGWLRKNRSGRSLDVGPEEFNPRGQPVHPLQVLAAPFRVMKEGAQKSTQRIKSRVARYVHHGPKLDGPPHGYLHLWLGNFRRWQRRFFVASESPGVLLIYKNSSMKGKVWTISLHDGAVEPDDTHPRQMRIVTAAGVIFLRAMRPEARPLWLQCLRDSISRYQRNKEVVEGLNDQVKHSDAGGPAPDTARVSPPGVVHLDADQRRRVRLRVAERMAELQPFQQELERHMGLLSQTLAGLAQGLQFGPAQQPSLNTPNWLSWSRNSMNAAATSANQNVIHSSSFTQLPVLSNSLAHSAPNNYVKTPAAERLPTIHSQPPSATAAIAASQLATASHGLSPGTAATAFAGAGGFQAAAAVVGPDTGSEASEPYESSDDDDLFHDNLFVQSASAAPSVPPTAARHLHGLGSHGSGTQTSLLGSGLITQQVSMGSGGYSQLLSDGSGAHLQSHGSGPVSHLTMHGSGPQVQHLAQGASATSSQGATAHPHAATQNPELQSQLDAQQHHAASTTRPLPLAVAPAAVIGGATPVKGSGDPAAALSPAARSTCSQVASPQLSPQPTLAPHLHSPSSPIPDVSQSSTQSHQTPGSPLQPHPLVSPSLPLAKSAGSQPVVGSDRVLQGAANLRASSTPHVARFASPAHASAGQVSSPQLPGLSPNDMHIAPMHSSPAPADRTVVQLPHTLDRHSASKVDPRVSSILDSGTVLPSRHATTPGNVHPAHSSPGNVQSQNMRATIAHLGSRQTADGQPVTAASQPAGAHGVHPLADHAAPASDVSYTLPVLPKVRHADTSRTPQHQLLSNTTDSATQADLVQSSAQRTAAIQQSAVPTALAEPEDADSPELPPGRSAHHDHHTRISGSGQLPLMRISPLPFARKPATSLAAAYAILVEAVQAGLYQEAVRVAQLEAENAALHKSLEVMRTSTIIKRSMSQGGQRWRAESLSARRSGGRDWESARSVISGEGSGNGGEDSDTSVKTADEDAFDVVEAFDEGVDYSILDDDMPFAYSDSGRFRLPGLAEEGSVSEHPIVPQDQLVGDLHHVSSSDVDEEEAEEDELEPEAHILNALESVRQVEYRTRSGAADRFAQLLATNIAPPPNAPEDEEAAHDTDVTLGTDDTDSDEGLLDMTRTALPAPRPLNHGFSPWTFLKNAIGRDLTRVTMPATINEPLSLTQRLAEPLEHRWLLEDAAVQSDPIDRLMTVTVWILAGYSSVGLRDSKPLNPLPGETYEWCSSDSSCRYLAEAISWQPLVVCTWADSSRGWSTSGELEARAKFWGKSIDLHLNGCEVITLKNHNETYRTNRAQVTVHDVLLGKYWVEATGQLHVRCDQTGAYAHVHLRPCRGRKNERGRLEGSVFNSAGQQVFRLSGSIHDKIYATLTPHAAAARNSSTSAGLMWQMERLPEDAAEQYNFSEFAITLNEPRRLAQYPPSDARHRPDARAMEHGEFSRAFDEKLKLEEKLRESERSRKNSPHQPLWFRRTNPREKGWVRPADQRGTSWQFTGQYWEHKAQGQWPAACPDVSGR